MISVHLILIPVDSGGFRLIPVFRRTRLEGPCQQPWVCGSAPTHAIF